MDSLHKAPKQKGKKCKNGLLALHINKIYKRLFFYPYWSYTSKIFISKFCCSHPDHTQPLKIPCFFSFIKTKTKKLEPHFSDMTGQL